MLQLKDIVKKYNTGGTEVEVLKKVNISFRESEFVSILGASGSGKTTLLNIIGGLDKYSSGDMLLMGRSTKEFTDRDWDSYRNGTIGFVFQSYNLIGHLSVIENVKLALSISGESNKENDIKAKKVLEDVGLGDHLYKKPNQLSGGQMQRVAIARALVTNPKVILADEPTGALDSKTSVQIMELIKEISKEKLVIMVTHNPELARKYSDRIVSVKDGEIIEDTKPYIEQEGNNGYELKKTAMAFSSAIKSSFKNLLTKKFRSLMTVVASSIGIISIGLVLAISSGMDKYIQTMQNENLSSMPITISSNQINFGIGEDNNTSDSSEENLVPKSRRDVHKNLYSEDALGNGETFIKYIQENAKDYYSVIDFAKGYKIKALTKNTKGDIVDVKMDGQDNFRGNTIFSVLPEDKNLIMNQFEIVKSLEQNFEYPKGDEVVLFTAKNNEIDKNVLKALGYSENAKVKYEDILGKEFSIVDNNNYYTKVENRFVPAAVDEKMYNAGTKVKIVAIAKAKDSFTVPQFTLGYTKELQDSLLSKEVSSEIVKEQEKDKSKNILTNTKMDNEVATEVLSGLGANTEPSSILIYPKTFNDRDKIANTISEYNKKVADRYGAGTEDYNKYSITYSDMAKQMTSIMSQMINTITLILTAFAGISLIVSSIMIGILTYVSVVERTKEIGILRAIGARKKDITRIFIAEAGLIGFVSGAVGVIVSSGLALPISKTIAKALKIDNFSAGLDIKSAVGLILLSVILTLIASVIPSRMAAKKDPVEALRTE
ncbi:ABC transporter ATP-binding protein/permease [Gemella sanguinis]|uniref:ABC transporter ATP-binding protein/permease n=1 Tax=Gemella sanguinis TaxID=84135 RepID=UPI0004E1925B|nr:ABC transporter ATP-binding protein/permease [Gemella sanguinis]NKZ26141.1 ATP-binding cassette domain-containing protein [Gemella sanguinis]